MSVLQGTSSRKRKSRKPGFEGSFQVLEDRRLLAVFTVDTLLDDATGGTDGLVSLREAIIAAETNSAFGDATAGDAGGDSIVFDASLDGLTIDISANGQFDLTDDLMIGDLGSFVTIDANGASRIFNINSAETMTFRNFGITDGSTNGIGGGIFFTGGGTLSLNEVILSNNSATMGGGGLHNDQSSVSIEDSRFEMNTAGGFNGRGGAIDSNGGSVTVTGSVLTGNSANLAGGGIAVTDTVVSIVDTEILGNMAIVGNGGGVAGFGTPDITVEAVTADSNTANGNGGAFWMTSAGRLTIKNASALTSNTASGPAVDNGGGAIFNSGAIVRILDSQVSSNQADGTSGSGGGVLTLGGILNIRRSNIFSNQAAAFGGGIEVGGGFARLEASTLGGANSSDANFAGLNSSFGDGGGLHVSGGAGTTVEIVGSNVSRNVALRDGGGLWNQADATLVINNMSFINNNVANGDTNGGGAVFNNGGIVVVENSTLTLNDALGSSSLGGAIQSSGGVVAITGSSINLNESRRAGGGISITGGALTIDGGSVTGNRAGVITPAPGNGGGLYVINGSFARLTGITLSSNIAENVGGGIASFASTVVVQGSSVVTGNEAKSATTTTRGGGGIFAEGGLVRVLESSLTNNNASGTSASGGGIDMETGTLLVRNSNVVSNQAVSKGGGIHVREATASVIGSTVGGASPGDGNTAERGAGLHFDRDTIAWVSASTVSNNTATLAGGGIFNHPTSNLRVSDAAVVSSNNADSGGGIYNAGLLSVVDSRLLMNEARVGGGLSNQPNAIAVIDTADIDGNDATFLGGGVQNAGIVNFIDGGEIKNNVSANTGGGVFTDSIGTTFLGSVTFSSNTPDDTNS